MPNFDFYRPSNGTYGHKNGAYINSAPIQIIDDFEDGDIAEYSGSTGSYSLEDGSGFSGSPYEGTWCLECSTSSTGTTIGSTTGLPNYPSAGDTFRYNSYSDTQSYNWSFYFGVQSETSPTSDAYRVLYNEGSSDSFYLQVVSGGSNTTLQNKTVDWSLYSSTWLETEVSWGSSGGITVTLYDNTGTQIVQLSATDTTYTSGGIAWTVDGNTGKTVRMDYARMG